MKMLSSSVQFAMTRFMATLLVCVFLSGPGAAQSNEFSAVHETLERIRQDLSDLQRYVYRGDAPAAPSPIPPKQAEVGAAERRAVDALIRITALEGELRGLTGLIEEINHKVDSAGRRLDKLVEDVDFRLSAIERSLADVSAMATQRLAAIQPEEGSPAAESPDEGTATQFPESSRERGVLGTLPIEKLPQGGDAARTVAAVPEEPKTLLPDGTPKERYDFALGLLREGLLRTQDLVRAEEAFKEFLVAHADDSLADNARYWLGESFYVRENYNQAAASFVEGYQASPTGAKAPDNLLKLGMSLSRLSRGDEACATFQELNEKFPAMEDRIKDRTQKEWQKAGCE